MRYWKVFWALGHNTRNQQRETWMLTRELDILYVGLMFVHWRVLLGAPNIFVGALNS